MKHQQQLISHGSPSSENLPYSTYVRAGDFIYLSGLVGFGDNDVIVPGGVEPETHQIMSTARSQLESANASLSDVIKVNVCLPDVSDFDAFNLVYARYFSTKAPARATICAGLTIEAAVEMEFIAFKPEHTAVS
ncbi:2-iminobutanoate/2-iminopropanoate deaminase [Ruegeria halocynthiae]|uniref:2-iminobutanoate/2-iminopropanoate deaminase n=1 Tax=Ruegeria halocynthiae TaxID=985054 RepID=A0A1H3EI67_9RHOB|nr:RidA family protein [Ruegeria halocynthiae]SDX78452.1 2-iminobutanoate/2-iminopropanoate deaminase [Ruegeria halocynthiae]